MRDEDGTEYQMVFEGPVVDADRERLCLKIPGKALLNKLLTSPLVGVDGPGTWGMELIDTGREVLDLIQGTRIRRSSQYAELGEDDLIELAVQKAQEFLSSPGEGEIADDLALVTLALKARRDEIAPARARIGEYLRQQAIVEAKYRRDLANSSEYTRKHAKEPVQDLDVIQADVYVPAVALRLPDLAKLVQPTVRDTETEFFVEQKRRLAILLERYQRTMPEKQQNILRCIAEGHYSYSSGWGGGSSYRHSDQSNGHDCGDRGNGNTMNALLNRKLHTSLPKSSMHSSATLMLAQPKTA
jgi:hypothetical protein